MYVNADSLLPYAESLPGPHPKKVRVLSAYPLRKLREVDAWVATFDPDHAAYLHETLARAIRPFVAMNSSWDLGTQAGRSQARASLPTDPGSQRAWEILMAVDS